MRTEEILKDSASLRDEAWLRTPHPDRGLAAAEVYAHRVLSFAVNEG